jgi:ribosome modulation factor
MTDDVTFRDGNEEYKVTPAGAFRRRDGSAHFTLWQHPSALTRKVIALRAEVQTLVRALEIASADDPPAKTGLARAPEQTGPGVAYLITNEAPDAHDQGHEAGLAGLSLTRCPYGYGKSQREDWIVGWKAGKRARAAEGRQE